MERVGVDGVEIAWAQAGVGDPALMFLHGYTGSSTDFMHHIDHFAQDRRVLTMDFRGHGQSGHGPADGYTFNQLARDLIAVVEQAGATQVDLLGHSMGGRIAMLAALERPDLVRSLILMSTSASPFPDDPWAYVSTVTDQLRIRGMNFLDENPYHEPGDWRLSSEALRMRRANRDALDVEAFIGLARELSCAPGVLEDLAKTQIPITLMVGRRDRMRTGTKEIAKAIPSARVHLIRRAYHSPQLSNPAQFREHIEDHLSRLATH